MEETAASEAWVRGSRIWGVVGVGVAPIWATLLREKVRLDLRNELMVGRAQEGGLETREELGFLLALGCGCWYKLLVLPYAVRVCE